MKPSSADRARRELGTAMAAAAVAGGLALSAAGQPWVEFTAVRRTPLPPVSAVLSGGDAAPLVPAAGLLLLAAAVALIAVRRMGRLAVGLVAALAGGALLWSGVRALTGSARAAAAVLPAADGATEVSAEVVVGWPLLTVAAGSLAVAAGLLVVLRARAWPAMGRRYERAGSGAGRAAAPAGAQDRAEDAWRALDRGEDPTDDGGSPVSRAEERRA